MTLVRYIRRTFIFLTLLSAIFAFVMYKNEIQYDWRVKETFDAYRPVKFQVLKDVWKPLVEYRHGGRSGPYYWTTGIIEGKPERLCFTGKLNPPPQSEAEFKSMVPPGRIFDAMYNPDVEEPFSNSKCLRVMPADGPPETFAARKKDQYRFILAYSFGPLALCLLVFILTGFRLQNPAVRRRDSL